MGFKRQCIKNISCRMTSFCILSISSYAITLPHGLESAKKTRGENYHGCQQFQRHYKLSKRNLSGNVREMDRFL